MQAIATKEQPSSQTSRLWCVSQRYSAPVNGIYRLISLSPLITTVNRLGIKPRCTRPVPPVDWCCNTRSLSLYRVKRCSKDRLSEPSADSLFHYKSLPLRTNRNPLHRNDSYAVTYADSASSEYDLGSLISIE